MTYLGWWRNNLTGDVRHLMERVENGRSIRFYLSPQQFAEHPNAKQFSQKYPVTPNPRQ